jgi:hypothetical protein
LQAICPALKYGIRSAGVSPAVLRGDTGTETAGGTPELQMPAFANRVGASRNAANDDKPFSEKPAYRGLSDQVDSQRLKNISQEPLAA